MYSVFISKFVFDNKILKISTQPPIIAPNIISALKNLKLKLHKK